MVEAQAVDSTRETTQSISNKVKSNVLFVRSTATLTATLYDQKPDRVFM